MVALLCLILVSMVTMASSTADDWDRCTTIAVGKNASTTGAPMTTHASDCSTCDFRLGKVPAKTHGSNATRDIVTFRLEYPRYVGDGRGDTYMLKNVDTSVYNWTASPIMGSIPQVPKTYAYLSGLYAIMNEHQVSMGECTCSGRLISVPISAGGKALFDIAELSHVAMERATTAREAIALMGELAETYGYYGAVWEGPMAYFESGETLTVADTNEVWVFHIHPDDTGASAVWVAQRVPDGDIAVVANQFIIQHVNLSDTDNFMGSKNMVDVAVRAQLYDPVLNGSFNFARVYSHPLIPDQYYATRRQWRVLTMANRHLELSPVTDTYALDYPFSTPVSSLISPATLMAFQRDHYEGSAFDLTQGPAAGPYGNPDRYDINGNGNMTKATALTGHFERAISIFRASYSFVAVPDPINSFMGTLWFGQYAPHATSYVPVYAHVDRVPAAMAHGSLHRYEMTKSMYWAFAVVGNWMTRFYLFIAPIVRSVQSDLESSHLAHQPAVATATQALGENVTAIAAYLQKQTDAAANATHVRFIRLFGELVTRFHDGYEMRNITAAPAIVMSSVFYPEWWLRRVGYFDKIQMTPWSAPPSATSATIVYAFVALALVVCGSVGFFIGVKFYMRQKKGYVSIL
ncbi:peptidase [Achlya hypogyna]|uniref:Peptidase n=1 Tax=Achlya hypogyna TaxID=1202772 RepID=A0A1V9ZRQ0_ACHHY|nr:peptidase [Achlya hypogyna]